MIENNVHESIRWAYFVLFLWYNNTLYNHTRLPLGFTPIECAYKIVSTNKVYTSVCCCCCCCLLKL